MNPTQDSAGELEHARPVAPAPTFTRRQWRALRTLRARYRQGCELFGERELAHLRFVRWLCQTGRLEP